MEFHRLTGSQPPAMYIQEVESVLTHVQEKKLEGWKWFWHTILSKPIPKVYSWSIHCLLEDNGYLVLSDIVEIHGIKYIVYFYGSTKVLNTMNVHDSPPDPLQLKGATVIHCGSSYIL